MKHVPLRALAAAACLALPAPSRAEGSEPKELPVAASRVVDIVLDSEHFTPIDLYRNGGDVVPITWRGCKAADIMSKLKKTKPEAVVSEPSYRGAKRLYGYLTLGTKKEKRHWFALDITAPDDMVMYFDYKADGRLDENPPLKNEGSFKKGENGFATLIEMPFADLLEDSPFDGVFKVWFILNSFQWANSGFTHASHTQLKGAADIGGVRYTVVIADRAENDADGDLSNDGLYLRRGKEEPRYIPAEEARTGVMIEGKRTVFRIRYGRAAR